ncbi:hypothetical protein CC78DRAFT_535674 [Lojkania enalia]|uniref:Conidiation-specific protein 6 n=1 Tax=Lojkania enalia TaxID=147567 RepID=A0A9P4N739_9PLEO|nr:hypothetical protein CC78DRAFT_535674 [Didymosphaeria enalia]
MQNREIPTDEDMQHINESPEDISNMAKGHKANLSNPNTSEESKKHSRQVLKALGGEDAFYSKDEAEKDAAVTGEYKPEGK